MGEKETIELVKQWVYEAADQIRTKLADHSHIMIEEKSSRTDLVTNIDRETEAFFVEKIRTAFPEDQILGEEGISDPVTSLAGRVWTIDPIDGTLNFVKQQNNFCIMLALIEDGVGRLGFIYSVNQDQFVYGGRGLGVFINQERLKNPEDVQLADGLLGVNAYMYKKNLLHVQEAGDASCGVRVSGCAGLEFISVLTGQQVGYTANLAPWDYAPGVILAKELGLETQKLPSGEIDFLEKTPLICGTPKVVEALRAINQK